jgi:hypothetical protein
LNELTIKEVYEMKLIQGYEINYEDGLFYFFAPISETWQLIFISDFKFPNHIFPKQTWGF